MSYYKNGDCSSASTTSNTSNRPVVGTTTQSEQHSAAAYPSVVMVTMVYQKASGMLVKLVPTTFFSA